MRFGLNLGFLPILYATIKNSRIETGVSVIAIEHNPLIALDNPFIALDNTSIALDNTSIALDDCPVDMSKFNFLSINPPTEIQVEINKTVLTGVIQRNEQFFTNLQAFLKIFIEDQEMYLAFISRLTTEVKKSSVLTSFLKTGGSHSLLSYRLPTISENENHSPICTDCLQLNKITFLQICSDLIKIEDFLKIRNTIQPLLTGIEQLTSLDLQELEHLYRSKHCVISWLLKYKKIIREICLNYLLKKKELDASFDIVARLSTLNTKISSITNSCSEIQFLIIQSFEYLFICEDMPDKELIEKIKALL
jgi:hypothetical protein